MLFCTPKGIAAYAGCAFKDEIWRLDRDLKDPVGAEKRMRKQSEDVTEWLERLIAQIYDNPGAVPKCAADPEG